MDINAYRPDEFPPFKVTVAPATEPVSTAEARAWVRQDTTADDSTITILIAAARDWVETHTHRALITQTRRAFIPQWPDDDAPILLPGGNVSATPSDTVVEYRNDAGTWTVLATSEYELEAATEDAPAKIWPSLSAGAWPKLSLGLVGDDRRRQGVGFETRGAIRITYVAGYGLAAAVPQPLRQAALLHVGWYYDHRNEPMGDDHFQALHRLIHPFRLTAF